MIPPIVERWLIAGALDQGRPLPPWLRRRVERSPELRHYADALRRVDSSLHTAQAPTLPPSPGRAARIADALALPRSPQRFLSPAWLGAAVVAGVLVLVVTLVVRGPGQDGPHRREPGHGAATLPRVPSSLRHGPIVALFNPVEGPLNEQWRTVSMQTRRSVSDFIRNLPGLPTENPAPRLN